MFLVTVSVAFAESITLTSPNGGESWMLGTSQNITWTWTGELAGTVTLILMKDGRRLGDIATRIPVTAGSYSWNVGQYSGGTAAAGGGYRIRIRHVSGEWQDRSDSDFAIVMRIAAVSPTKIVMALSPVRTIEIPGIIGHCYKRVYQETTAPCLNTMGLGPHLIARPGEMQVGYANHFDDRGACRDEWINYVYRGWIRFGDDGLRSLAGKRIDKAELKLHNSAISVRYATGYQCARPVWVLDEPGREGFEGYDVASHYLGDLPLVRVGSDAVLDITALVRQWIEGTVANHGLMIRSIYENFSNHSNDECISIFNNVRLVVQCADR